MTEQVKNAERLPLSAKPKWIVPRIFKWMSIVFFCLGVIALCVGFWLQLEINALVDNLPDEQSYDARDVLSYELEEAGLSLLLIFPGIALLWIISLVAEKVDDLVWLQASREDQDSILAKRKKKPSNA